MTTMTIVLIMMKTTFQPCIRLQSATKTGIKKATDFCIVTDGNEKDENERERWSILKLNMKEVMKSQLKTNLNYPKEVLARKLMEMGKSSKDGHKKHLFISAFCCKVCCNTSR